MDTYRNTPKSGREILNAGWAIYKARFLNLLVVTALTYAPIGIIALMITMESLPLASGVQDGHVVFASQESLDRFGALVGWLWLATWLGGMVSMASLHHAVAETYLGRASDWRESVRAGVRKIGWVLVHILVTALLIGLPAIVVAAVSGGSGPIATVAIILYAVWVVAISVLSTIAMPVIMREELTPIAALGRTRELLRERWLASFGLLLVAGLVTGLLWAIVNAPAKGGLTANATSASGFIGGVLAANLIASIVVFPLLVAIITVAYFDLRVRNGEPADPHASAAPAMPAPLPRPMPLPVGAPQTTPAPPASSTVAAGRPPDARPDAPVGEIVLRPRWAEPLGPQ